MPTRRADARETQRRLLEAAVVLFAAKGFRNTRTADICRQAGANVAAVNYHFGGKEALYAQAWRHAFERGLAAYPPDGGVSAQAPAEERLRGHIMANVRRFMDPANHDLDIADREMADPTGLLAEVIHRSLAPLHRVHQELVRGLLGPGATDEQIDLCVMSVHSQCIAVLMHERRRRLAPSPRSRHLGPPRLKVTPETLADHIARFSLAGIREIARGVGRSTREGRR